MPVGVSAVGDVLRAVVAVEVGVIRIPAVAVEPQVVASSVDVGIGGEVPATVVDALGRDVEVLGLEEGQLLTGVGLLHVDNPDGAGECFGAAISASAARRMWGSALRIAPP